MLQESLSEFVSKFLVTEFSLISQVLVIREHVISFITHSTLHLLLFLLISTNLTSNKSVILSFKSRDWFFFISQNVAICPKTFSNHIDSYYKWHTGVTSSDVSPV